MSRSNYIQGIFKGIASGVLFVLFFCVLHITPSIAHAEGGSKPSSHEESNAHSAQCIDHSVIRHHDDDAIHTAVVPVAMPVLFAESMPILPQWQEERPLFRIIDLLPERRIFIRDNDIRT